MRKLFTICFCLVALPHLADGQDREPSLPPVATLNLSASSSLDTSTGWASIAFTSDSTIALGACLPEYLNQSCSLRLVKWDGATLHQLAQTSRFDYGISIHPAGGGRILGLKRIFPVIVYSSDLSASRELPKDMPWLLSPSGELAARGSDSSWKVYRFTEGLELLREVRGRILFLSENVLLIQGRKLMRVETLDGKPLGSFSTPSDGYYFAATLGSDRLWLDDAKIVRIADFNGRIFLKFRPGKDCGRDDLSPSSDGGRVLLDCNNHKSSGLKHVLESIQTVTTLGMAGPEDVNHEEVRVFNTATGRACFEWQGSFPATYAPHIRSAAISPSGDFVAIVSKSKLAIYRIPTNCQGLTSVAADH